MAIDYTTETVVPLNKAPQHYPGTRPHISTVYRHALNGALETFKVGGKRFTSIEAIRRFVARSTNPETAPRPALPGHRERGLLAANKRLDAIGI